MVRVEGFVRVPSPQVHCSFFGGLACSAQLVEEEKQAPPARLLEADFAKQGEGLSPGSLRPEVHA